MIGLTSLPALDVLNDLPVGPFTEAVGQLFEQAPRFLARLAADRPFASWEAFFERALQIALAMPEADQLELIDGHARLGADPAALRARSELSYREQGYDRPPPAADPSESADVATELERLNDLYERAFGFRFVVFVAGRPHAELMPMMSAALLADRDAEIRRALADVVAIARDRAAKLSIDEARS